MFITKQEFVSGITGGRIWSFLQDMRTQVHLDGLLDW